MAETPSLTAPRGYSIVLPPGWLRFGVRDGSGERALARALDEAFQDVPRDSAAPFRAELEGQVRRSLEEARRLQALDLYLPLLGVRGRPVPASMVVAERLLPPGGPRVKAAPEGGAGGDLNEEVVAALLSELAADGTLLPLPAGPCARVESVLTDRPEGEGLAARRVDYHLPVPHDPRRWVTVACTVADGLDPLTGIVVELFEAMLGTWSWRSERP